MITTDFIVEFASLIYQFVRVALYFCFEYSLFSTESFQTLSYYDPFYNITIDLSLPTVGKVGGGFLGNILLSILEKFNIDQHITIIEFMIGPVLVLVLAYAVIKYLIPVS